MSYIAKNNAYARLASGISESTDAITLEAGEGGRFPVIAEPHFTLATLDDGGSFLEIVRVIGREAASDVLTVVRGQEGTVARSFNAGDAIELRMTAALVEEAMAHPVKTSDAHVSSAISASAVGGLKEGSVASQLEELAKEKQAKFDVLPLSQGGTGAKTRHAALVNLGIEAPEETVLTLPDNKTDIASVNSQNILLTALENKTITGFALADSGTTRKIRVGTDDIKFTHSATFLLPSQVDIVTKKDDVFEVFATAIGWVVREYTKHEKALRLNENNIWTKAQRGAVLVLPFAASVVINFDASNNFEIVLSGNATLATPVNAVAGQSGIINVRQDGSGNRALSYASGWEFASVPVLTTTENAKDLLAYYVTAPNKVALSIQKGVK